MASPAGVFDRVLARVGKQVVRCVERGGVILVHARSIVRCAPCPSCRSWSRRRHASYTRRLAERPVLDKRIELRIEIHRFKCSSIGCPRSTFSEDIHGLAGRHQRRTRSHTRALIALGYALGGAAAARLATELGLSTCADTVIRQLRRSAGIQRERRPRIVGIDDWAIAKGHHYGTLIVDLERREPIEVLVGREATAVEAWLREHPSIKIVARDRAGVGFSSICHF
jgi:transposase